MSSRSSIFSIVSRRRAKLSKSSFSSARIREHRTPILTSLAPVFLFLGSEPQLDRIAVDDLKLRAAVAARDDLALLDVRGKLDIGGALRALRRYRSCHYATSSLPAQPRALIRSLNVPPSLQPTSTGSAVCPWTNLPSPPI